MIRIGISLTSTHANPDPRVGAASMIDRARAANAVGLDSLFVGDHHVTPIPYFQNTAILGRLLAEWGSRPAGALYLLPLHHPVMLAEHVGTLAAIAEGRFILQCAIGPDDRQLPAFGVGAKARVPRFEASQLTVSPFQSRRSISSDASNRGTRAFAPTPNAGS